MSLQVASGAASLVSLGFSIGDIAVLASLGKKLGSWLTADENGTRLLELLNLDEFEIFKHGLMDYTRFNKRWGSSLILRVNNRVETFSGKRVEKVLDDVRPFTAVMVCLTASLDAFVGRKAVRETLKRVLVNLFSALDSSEEAVKSELHALHNGWLSTADVRGISGEVRSIRSDLIRSRAVLDGLMHPDDVPSMVQFLLWLLKDHGETTFTTSSSDIAGVAFCLRKLGMEILSIDNFMEPHLPTQRRLIYSHDAIVERPGHDIRHSPSRIRITSTAVSLNHPEESLTIFPLESKNIGNQCRMAWKEGEKAAKGIACSLIPFDPANSPDLVYAFVTQGTPPGRVDPNIYKLASVHFFGVNQELLDGLQVIFQQHDPAALDWLHSQAVGGPGRIPGVQFALPDQTDIFTVFQAFAMGYYYAIFLRLVDISMLKLKLVEGCWGFKSPEFLKCMRDKFVQNKTISPGTMALTRGEVIYILSMLLCNTDSDSSHIYPADSGGYNRCVGFVGKRTLLAKSLVSPCCTLRDVGGFVLFDCDASGIPRDKHGWVRPGISVTDVNVPHGIRVETVTEDLTFHIQPDWDANEESLLLCVRYRGRRVTDLDPWLADARFCTSLVRPVPEPKARETESLKWTAADLLSLKPIPVDRGMPIVIQAEDRPRLQYAATVLYSNTVVKLATNCVETAIKGAMEEAIRRMRPVRAIVIVNKLQSQAKSEDWCYLPYPTAGHDRHQVEQLDERRAARGTFGAEGWKNLSRG